MPPPTYFKKAVGSLMAAYRGCTVYQPEIDSGQKFIYPTNRSDQYKLTDAAWESIASVVRRSAENLDRYPESDFAELLQHIVADARHAHPTPSAAVSTEIEARLRAFFVKLGKQEDWEVLFAVTGIARDQSPFTLGSVRFFVLNQEVYQSWRLPLVPHFAQLNGDMVGSWVALLRLPAIDQNHAMAKALCRLDTVLNSLRYGFFLQGDSARCVRLGGGSASYWGSQSLARPVSFPKAVGQSMKGGSDGLRLQICKWTLGYEELVRVIEKEPSNRTSLEEEVLAAITWVGQAAAAALNPVRLALLVTALEVLLIDDHESLGKRNKIANRLTAIVPQVLAAETQAAAIGDRLYHLRSECLHTGFTGVTEDDVKTAFEYTTAVVKAFLTLPPFNACANLSEILAIIDPKTPTPPDYSI